MEGSYFSALFISLITRIVAWLGLLTICFFFMFPWENTVRLTWGKVKLAFRKLSTCFYGKFRFFFWYTLGQRGYHRRQTVSEQIDSAALLTAGRRGRKKTLRCLCDGVLGCSRAYADWNKMQLRRIISLPSSKCEQGKLWYLLCPKTPSSCLICCRTPDWVEGRDFRRSSRSLNECRAAAAVSARRLLAWLPHLPLTNSKTLECLVLRKRSLTSLWCQQWHRQTSAGPLEAAGRLKGGGGGDKKKSCIRVQATWYLINPAWHSYMWPLLPVHSAALTAKNWHFRAISPVCHGNTAGLF